MPYIVRNGIVYSAGGGGSGEGVTKQTVADWGFYELPEGGIPAKDLAEGVIPTIPESLPASDVPSWAKQPTKPSYTASEVGALSADGKAADSDKLDGHDSGYFATTTSVTALSEDVSRHAFGEQSGGKNLVKGAIYINAGQWTNAVILTEKILLRNGVTYCISFDTPSTGGTVYFPYYGKTVQGYRNISLNGERRSLVITMTEDVFADNILQNPSTIDTGIISNLMIEEGSSASPYEPYIKSNAMLTELADESEVRDAELRVLGWNVPNGMALKNTVENGVFTQKVGRVDLGSLTFSGRLANYTNNPSVISQIRIPSSLSAVSNGYCTVYAIDSWANVNSKVKDKTIAIYGGSSGGIYINDSANEGNLSSLLNNVYLYYELATPITHNLTDMPSQKSMLGKEWDSTVEYKLSNGDKYLIHENGVYEILADNQNMRPDLHPEFWKKQTVFDILANMSGSGFP